MTVKSGDKVVDSNNLNENDMGGYSKGHSSQLPSSTIISERLRKMLLAGSFCGISDDGEGNDTVLNMASDQSQLPSESNNVANKPSPLNTGIEWLDSLELEGADSDNKGDDTLASPTSVSETDVLQQLPPAGVSDKVEVTTDSNMNATIDWNGSSSSDTEAPCLSLCTSNNSIRSIPRSVSFADSVVTHVRETPRYRPEDVSKMFYSRKDIQRLVYLLIGILRRGRIQSKLTFPLSRCSLLPWPFLLYQLTRKV
jgi:hypothetical protein